MKPGPAFRQRFEIWRPSLGWADLLTAVAAVNVAGAAFIAWRLGGDALNGHVDHGRYFLRLGARFTEVDRSTFVYSQVHTALTLGLMGVAAIARGTVRSAERRADKALARRVRDWKPL